MGRLESAPLDADDCGGRVAHAGVAIFAALQKSSLVGSCCRGFSVLHLGRGERFTRAHTHTHSKVTPNATYRRL